MLTMFIIQSCFITALAAASYVLHSRMMQLRKVALALVEAQRASVSALEALTSHVETLDSVQDDLQVDLEEINLVLDEVFGPDPECPCPECQEYYAKPPLGSSSDQGASGALN